MGSTVLAGAAAIEADDTSTVGRADRHKRHSLSGGNVHAIKPGCGGIIPDEKVFPVRSPSVDDVVAAKFWKSANLRSGHRVSLGRVAVHAKQHLAIRLGQAALDAFGQHRAHLTGRDIKHKNPPLVAGLHSVNQKGRAVGHPMHPAGVFPPV